MTNKLHDLEWHKGTGSYWLKRSNLGQWRIDGSDEFGWTVLLSQKYGYEEDTVMFGEFPTFEKAKAFVELVENTVENRNN